MYIDLFIYLFIQSLPCIPPGRVVRCGLFLKCYTMMTICCPSMIWGHVGAIFEMYQEDLRATWVYVGVILSNARVILVLILALLETYLQLLLIKPMVFV